MHSVSAVLLLTSLGAVSLAQNLQSTFHGVFFTSTDPDCLLLQPPIVPTDDVDRGQFIDNVSAVRSELRDCTLFFRQEVDGEIEEDPVLVITAGDTQCHELPESGLHWNASCDSDKEDGGEGKE